MSGFTGKSPACQEPHHAREFLYPVPYPFRRGRSLRFRYGPDAPISLALSFRKEGSGLC